MPEEHRGQILVLEDDEGVTHLVRMRLERLGYSVVSATTPDDALGLTARENVDLVVLDYRLRGDLSGLDFYRQLQACGQEIPAILVTGFSDEAKVIEAIRSGVRDFVPKTTDFLDYLQMAIERVMGQVRTARQASETEAIRRNNDQLQRLIGERQRLEEELRASNEQLVVADRRKNEFIAMLAHELRNPLAAIVNSVRLLRQTTAREHHEWCQDVIERQSQHLGRLLDDLLDVSRITQGKIELRRQSVDLRAVAERATATIRPLVEEKAQTLTVDLAPGPLRLEADPARVEQILVNLLNNAAKYTDRNGRITLSARSERDDIVIEVKDSGVGIAPEMLPRVFDLFTQVNDSLAHSRGGLGIGLSLVKQLAELHGGSVEARSRGLGEGSEFIVRLPRLGIAATGPAAAEAGEMSEPVTAGSRNGARVLIVDDNLDAARGMSRLICASGFDVRTVFDGQSAIETARIFRPAFILLDIGLPGADGYEVARTIRAEPGCEGVVFIAVSGYAQERDQARSREAGFSHHLVKPVDLDALLELLGRSPASLSPTRNDSNG